MNKFLGIDLGTTYSCVSAIDALGKPVVLKNSEGETTTASVVFFESETNIVVGNYAKESLVLYPDRAISYAKRSIGLPGINWEIFDKERTPEEVCSYILRKLVNDANAVLRSENKIDFSDHITDVVITCPAYFGVTEREAVRSAGEIAGLNVIGIINEPTAAAITYGLTDAVENKVVLVYDLGGGTFDITLIEIGTEAIKVICTGGDHTLGGKVWDDRIINYLTQEFARQTKNYENILDDPETYQEISLAAERAKKMLTAREKAPVAINYKGERARVELTREQFDSFTADLVERTIFLTRQLLDEAIKKGYDLADVDEILLVGGSTRMPQIQSRVSEAFNTPIKIYDPDESVAKGAALYAARQNFFNQLIDRASYYTGESPEDLKRDFDRRDTSLAELAKKARVNPDQTGVDIINVTGRSFGTIAYENKTATDRKEVLYNLILRNTELPAKESRQFFTVVPNQNLVTIQVLESLATQRFSDPEEGLVIGETVLELPSGLPAGSPLDIEFCLNEDGMLEVSAKETVHNSDIIARFEIVDEGQGEKYKAAKKRLEKSMIL